MDKTLTGLVHLAIEAAYLREDRLVLAGSFTREVHETPYDLADVRQTVLGSHLLEELLLLARELDLMTDRVFHRVLQSDLTFRVPRVFH
jgi:hypothetical protein